VAVLLVQGKTGQALVAPIGWQLVTFPLLIVVARSRNRLEQQRQELQQELEEANRLELVGRMAGGIAHDFNNLLMVITTSSQLARELEGEELHEVLDDLDDARTRAAQLTSQLLAFARRQVLRPTDIDLAEVTRAFGGVLTAAANKRLTIDVGTDELVVNADVSQLEQVLLNLVVNARDAIGDAGHITLRLRRAATGPAGTDLEDRPCALLEVSDDGVGIPPDVLPHIFEPFFTTKDRRGTGLGLSTTFGVIHQHAGQLDVESQIGVGTTFRAHLPLIDTPVAERMTPSPLEHVPHARRVLLVDDDGPLLRVLARALEGEGYLVQALSSPADALARLDGGLEVDLVVSDVHMPAMEGPAFVRAVRDRRPAMPAVFITGYAFDADYGGLDDVEILGKPVEISDVDAAIRRALPQG
jgi:two-component system cell cycle sensor histidine kinase/response regulator CckA